MIQLQNITYRYPLTETPVLRDVNLSIKDGEFVGVIGPNGAGKSTLCYTLSGFIPHFFKGELAGEVHVDGADLRTTALSEWVMNVGLVFQNPFNQITGAKYTVHDEIAFGLENMGLPRGEMQGRVEEAMELAGVTHLAQRSPYSLSGGQQQRVALASILVMQPHVLVLDEPTSQLDPIGTREVFAVIRAMSQRGMTVILVEHKLEWMAAFADRIVALYEGQVLLDGTPGDVLTDPRLEEKGFGLSRYTRAARAAAGESLWPAGRRLPVTLDDAFQGFSTRQEGESK